MKIADGIIQTIKKTTHHTYWGNKNIFLDFLGNNDYFILPKFTLNTIDDTHDKLVIIYDDVKINCVITWKESLYHHGGVIMDNIELK